MLTSELYQLSISVNQKNHVTDVQDALLNTYPRSDMIVENSIIYIQIR